MTRLPTALIAALTLVVGFAAAQAVSQPVGGAVLLVGVAWCVLREARRTAAWRLLLVVLVGAAAFAASHALAGTLGPWPSVLLAAAVLGATAWTLVDRPPTAGRRLRRGPPRTSASR